MRDPAASSAAEVVPSVANLGILLAKLDNSALVLSRGTRSQRLLTIISVNTVVLILDKILGFIKFSSNILLGNCMSGKEAFPFSNTSLHSCLSHPMHLATIR